MKKLLLITLTTLTNVSYASFLVTENRQIDIGNIPPNIKYNNGDPNFDKAATLSWILVLSAILFLLLNMGFNTDLTGVGVILIMLAIFAVAVVYAVIGLFSKRRWWQDSLH